MEWFRLGLIAISLLLLALQWKTLVRFHRRTSSQIVHDLESTDNVQRQRLFLRYDEAGIQPLPGTARSHRLPHAVPPSRTVPRHLGSNRTYMLSQRTNTSTPSILRPLKILGTYNPEHDYATDFRPLYLYNPSVLPLHNTIENTPTGEVDPDWLSPNDLQQLTGGDPLVRYVALFRAYLGNNCFGADPLRQMMTAGEQISYLAVALLDESLNVIPNTDVLIDVNAGPGYGKYRRQFREDCRIFLLRGSIYWVCNEGMHQVKIVRSNTTVVPEPNDTSRLPYTYPNIYGNGLQITLMGYHVKLAGGKNFQLFRSPASKTGGDIDTGTYDYYVQTYPVPHKYKRLNILDSTKTSIVHPKRLPLFPKSSNQDPSSESTMPVPPNAFDTPDVHHTVVHKIDCNTDTENATCTKEIAFFPHQDHGSACCVEMELQGKGVIVGISHAKFNPQKKYWKLDTLHRYDSFAKGQYVSRFLAYTVDPPFDIVAASGWFCLGFANPEESVNGNSLAGLNTEARLDLFNETYSCPIIHFVSGFSEYVGDPTKAIIAYGVNDCHPRMMVVKKSDIEKRLLGLEVS